MNELHQNPSLTSWNPGPAINSDLSQEPPPVDSRRPDPTRTGMLTFLASEVAFFGTLIMTFLFYLKQIAHSDPGPSQVFEMGLVILSTICLLSSSITIHLAELSLHRENRGGFLFWWGLTIVLGALFLLGTAHEWNDLIFKHHLTINRNIFGSAYFTLVGFHAAHVTLGLILLIIIFLLAIGRKICYPTTREGQGGITVISWYWHFVDAVWIVVFFLVYIVARGMA